MNPLVCIILLNYNTYKDTVECVNSLKKIRYDNYRIILVDNHSEDSGFIKQDKTLNNYCDILYAKENNGFSAGNNIGIEFSRKKYRPDYYLIINNDTIVEEEFLLRLVETAETSEKVGIVTGQICYYSNKRERDFVGGYFDRKRGRAGYYDPKEGINRTKISFATGCMWLIPARVIELVGLLDEKYFMYCEDVEYSCRVIDYGFEILYCDAAIIYHKGAGSSGVNSKFHQYYMTRNALYIIQKYAEDKPYAYLSWFKNILRDIVHREKKLFVVVQAMKAFWMNELGRSARY